MDTVNHREGALSERVLRLLDSLLEAYDIWHVPKEGSSFCNFSVQHVAGRMGYDKLKNMVANQVVDFLRRSSDWQKVEMSEAQGLANDGRLVVAGAQAEPHGHVVVVRPGVEEYSAKWQAKAPKVSHVGGMSYIGRSLAWAFKDVPELWVLK